MELSRAPAGLRRLVDQEVLTSAQLSAVLAALEEDNTPPRVARSGSFAEVAAYTGAALLLSGVGLVIAASWNEFAQIGRVLLFVCVAMVFVGVGAWLAGPGALFVMMRRGGAKNGETAAGARWSASRYRAHSVRARLAAVLFIASAISVASAVGSGLDGTEGDVAWAWAGIAASVSAVAGYLALPSLPGVFACAIFAAFAVSSGMDELLGTGSTGVGVGLLVLGLIWLVLTRFGVVTESWAGYSVGVVTAILGAQNMTTSAIPAAPAASYLLTGLVALVSFGLYFGDRSWSLLLGGAAALTVAAVEAVWHSTDGSLGAAGVVLVIGAAVLGGGTIVLARTGRESVRRGL